MKNQIIHPMKAVLLTGVLTLFGLAMFAQPNYNDVIVASGEESVTITTDNLGQPMYVVEYYSYNQDKCVKQFVKQCVKARTSTHVFTAKSEENVVYDKATKTYTFRGQTFTKVSDLRDNIIMWVKNQQLAVSRPALN